MRQKQHNKISDSMFELSDEEIYKLVLHGNIRSFPKGFWEGEDGNKRAIKIFKYVFSQILNWDIDDIIKNYSKKVLKENKLNSILKKSFEENEVIALITVFPELKFEGIYQIILNGNIKSFDDEFYKSVEGKTFFSNVIRYLIEKVLKWSINDIISNFTIKTLTNNNLNIVLNNVYNGDEMEALKSAYPEIRKMYDDVIRTLKEMTFNNEKIPSKDNIEKLYSEYVIKFFFKSFQNLNIILKNDYSRQELIDMLKAKKKKLSKNPSNLDMKAPQAIIFIREFDTVNWNEILVKAGL